MPVSQPIAAHSDIHFATNTEWITWTIPNPATECPPMLHPCCDTVHQPQWRKVRNRTSFETRHAAPEQLFRRIKSTPQSRKTPPRTPTEETHIRRNLAEGS